jgi:hypothetical protein
MRDRDPLELTPHSNAAWLPLGVFLFHTAVGYGLYGGAAVFHWKLNEFIVIELPFGYSPWFARHGAMRLVASFLCPLFSLCVYMIAALNQWGS